MAVPLTCIQDAQRVQVVHAGCDVDEAAADRRLCANKLSCQAFNCGSANALMCGSRQQRSTSSGNVQYDCRSTCLRSA